MVERQSVRRMRSAGAMGATAIVGVLLVQVAAIVMLSLVVGDSWRPFIRLLAMSIGLVAIAIVLFLYLRVARPAEKRWGEMILRLEESRERFSSMFDFHPDAVAVISESGRIVRTNGMLERVSQYRAEELEGARLEMLASAQDAIEHVGFGQPLFSEVSLTFDAAMRTKTGSSVMMHVDTVPMRVRGRLEGVYVIARDVTHERELEFRESVQRERLRSLARIAALHAGSVDRQITETLEYAMRTLELQGATVSRIQGDQVRITHSVGDSIPVGTAFPFGESYTRHVFGTNKIVAFWDHDNEFRGDAAHARWGWGSLIAVTAFADGVAVGGLALMSRRTRSRAFEEADLDFARIAATMIGASLARENREDELEEIAYVDAVTRLPNRRYAMDQLRLAIARAERSGEQVVVYFVDLDGFKAINDEYGHAVGDEFLAITATRLRAVLREGDVVARVGGDEFLVMQITSLDDANAMRLGGRLIEAASERVPLDDRQSLRVGASIGIAAYPKDADTAEDLLDRADQAMYASKRAGKGVATRVT